MTSSSSSTVILSQSSITRMELHRVAEGKPMAKQTVLSIIVKLGAILVKYGNNKDLLSMNLLVAGHTFTTYAVTNIRKPAQELLRGCMEKLDVIKKVLQNPHGPNILQNPWLVANAATWEKSTFDEYKRFAIQFEGKEISATPHEFAKAVINWVEELCPKKSLEPILLSLQVPVGNPVILSKELLEYQSYLGFESLIKQALSMRLILQEKLVELEQKLVQVEQLEKMNAFLENANIQGFKRLQEDLARQEQSSLQQTAELKRSLSANATQQKETVSIYQKINAEGMADLHQSRVELKDAKIQMNTLQRQVNSLCDQLNSCHAQLGHLQHEINNQDSCTIV